MRDVKFLLSVCCPYVGWGFEKVDCLLIFPLNLETAVCYLKFACYSGKELRLFACLTSIVGSDLPTSSGHFCHNAELDHLSPRTFNQFSSYLRYTHSRVIMSTIVNSHQSLQDQ